VQRLLLQKLALRENAAKGLISKWPSGGPDGQRSMNSKWEVLSGLSAPVSEGSLEAYREEISSAISSIWAGDKRMLSCQLRRVNTLR
jgi:hypothetical protein